MKNTLSHLVLILAAACGRAPSTATARSAAPAAGVLSPAESAKILDDWRNDDQDAYGSETFDYVFKTYQCFALAQPECDLAYTMKITGVEVVGRDGKVIRDETPPFVGSAGHQPLLARADDGSWSGRVVPHATGKGKGSYEGRCAIKIAAGIKDALFDAKGNTRFAPKALMDECLARNDRAAARLVLGKDL